MAGLMSRNWLTRTYMWWSEEKVDQLITIIMIYQLTTLIAKYTGVHTNKLFRWSSIVRTFIVYYRNRRPGLRRMLETLMRNAETMLESLNPSPSMPFLRASNIHMTCCLSMNFDSSRWRLKAVNIVEPRLLTEVSWLVRLAMASPRQFFSTNFLQSMSEN